MALAIIIAALIIADAIMFVNGYRGYFFGAKTETEKAIRKKWFADRGVDWDPDVDDPPGVIRRWWRNLWSKEND